MSLRPAVAADAPAVAGMLARAFSDDPVARYLFPNRATRQARLQGFFRVQLRRVYLPRGTVDVTEDRAGAALWLGPDLHRAPWQDLAAQLGLLALLGPRLPATRRLARSLAARHPEEPHCYLGTIGIEPARQHEGIGTALLRVGLARCDARQVPAYLECSTERARSLYERMGFRVVDVLDVVAGPRLWLMQRAPREANTVAEE